MAPLRSLIEPTEAGGAARAPDRSASKSSAATPEPLDHFSFDPERPDFAPYGLTCVRWQPSPMRRPDHHNEVELNFLESGSVTYLLGGRRLEIGAGQLTAFWAAIPHQIIEFGSEPSYYVATVPLPWFLQWRLPVQFVQALLRGQIVQEPARARSMADAYLFAQWAEDLRQQNEQTREAVLHEMHARLIRLAQVIPAVKNPVSARDPMSTLTEAGLSKVERMACFVAQRYRERITVRDIARIVGLHPNYAMALFQKTFGNTLVSYLTQHRVSHAQRLLVTSNLTMTEVAFDSGFNSLSRFNEAFRRICGCAPRDYRRSNFVPNVAAPRLLG
jgi:AraC-like DNA-binding protein/mannose-6-phosphate isomerase-like protein (cupin superfamily)